jgi:hypothetical protein
LRSAQWISRLNGSSKGGHDDDDDNGLSRCPVANDEVGETQSETLVFEGSRLKWIPCTGSGELAIISGIIEENLLHRKASDFDPFELHMPPDGGRYRNEWHTAQKSYKRFEEDVLDDEYNRCFRVTGMVSPTE